MVQPYRLTKLSVQDEVTGSWVYEMGDRDIASIPFDPQEPLESAAAEIIEVGSERQFQEAQANIVNGIVRVPVSGLKRGKFYELAVTFTGLGGVKWTRTLVLHCVT